MATGHSPVSGVKTTIQHEVTKMKLKDFNKVNSSYTTTYTVFDRLGRVIEVFSVFLGAKKMNIDKLEKYIEKDAEVTSVYALPSSIGNLEVYLTV